MAAGGGRVKNAIFGSKLAVLHWKKNCTKTAKTRFQMAKTLYQNSEIGQISWKFFTFCIKKYQISPCPLMFLSFLETKTILSRIPA